MMDKENIAFTLSLRENIKNEIKGINNQLQANNESIYDTDRECLRDMRERLISLVDYVNHLEMKGLLEEGRFECVKNR